MSENTGEDLEQLAKDFFARAESLNDTRQTKFCAEYKVSQRRLNKAFPSGKWRELQDQWALARIRPALEETYISALVRDRFSIPNILNRIRAAGIKQRLFLRIAGEDWRDRRMRLPTVRDKVLTAIDELVANRIQAGELTHKLIIKKAGISWHYGRWFTKALLEARRKLLTNQSRDDSVKPPDGVRALAIPGGWIDLDADVWDLRSGGGAYLKRSSLRRDVAEIAWTLLRNDLLEKHLTCATVKSYYDGYRWAGEILGKEVPNVREATLERVQRAWLHYEGRPRRKAEACAALRKIFTRLYSLSTEVPGIDGSEMLLISSWLYTFAPPRRPPPNEDFLSEREMDELIACCLIDVKAGLDFTDAEVDLLNFHSKPSSKDNAVAVVNWALALMILLMLFTGLRRQSVLNLKISDVAELHPNLFVVIWSHGKKREENVAILVKSIALLINQYVKRTAKLREALGTENVFLSADGHHYWRARRKKDSLSNCLRAFTKRHGLERDGRPLNLNGMIFRRTYVTRELYMGRSIWALRLQLGHLSIVTTRRYGKFDLYEHPGAVGAALDEYGRKSLTLWHRPLLLKELDPAERGRLLGLKKERDQDVGMCRHASCIKISTGSPPPCSLCEHLVTGPEFFEAWDEEQKGRELDMARLQSTPGADDLLAQKRCQYELFKENRAFVKGQALP